MSKGVAVAKTLESMIMGAAPKRTHLSSMVTVVILYLIMISISIGFFPTPGYSLLVNQISDMGGIATNPAAWWVFDVTEVALGLMMIPHFLYLYRRLVSTTKWVSRVALYAGIVGSLGFAFVGLIPQDYPDPHNAAAYVAFSGFTISAFLVMCIFIIKLVRNAGWPTRKHFWLLYGPLFVTFPLILFMPSLGSIATSWAVDIRWFSWPPWQWTFMFSLMYWMIIIALILPDRPVKA
jgi:hypothetical membrane protein